VLENTGRDCKDYLLLEAALTEIRVVALHINEHVRDKDNVQRMLGIQRRLVGGQPRIVVPGRRFIKEGTLMKVSRKGNSSQERLFFLFNDMLMYCKQSACKPKLLECCCVLPIQHCTVEPVLWGGSLFKLACHDETLLLYTENQEEGQEWIGALKAAIGEFTENRQTLKRLSSGRYPLRRGAIRRRREPSLSAIAKARNVQLNKKGDPQSSAVRDSLYPMRRLYDVMSPCSSQLTCTTAAQQCGPRTSVAVGRMSDRVVSGLSSVIAPVADCVTPCRKRRRLSGAQTELQNQTGLSDSMEIVDQQALDLLSPPPAGRGLYEVTPVNTNPRGSTPLAGVEGFTFRSPETPPLYQGRRYGDVAHEMYYDKGALKTGVKRKRVCEIL